MIFSPEAQAQDLPAPSDGRIRLPVPNPSATPPRPPPPPPISPAPQPLPLHHPRPRTNAKSGAIRIVTANVQGLGDDAKAIRLFKDLRSMEAHVTMLQETKLTSKRSAFTASLWREPSVFGCAPVAARGVAILFGRNSPFVPQMDTALVQQRLVAVPATLGTRPFLFINSYAPNEAPQREAFFQQILFDLAEAELLDPPELSIVWGGDFNCVSDSAFDRLHPNNHSPFPASLNSALEEMELVDTFRLTNPSKREFSWHGPAQSTRIDYLFLSRHSVHLIKEATMPHNPESDHKMVVLDLLPPQRVDIGKGLWSLNPQALNAPALLSDIQTSLLLHPRMAFPTATEWFSMATKEFKRVAFQHQKRLDSLKCMKLEALTEQLKNLEDLLAAQPLHPTARADIKVIKTSIYKEKIEASDYARTHSAAKFFKNGEKCTKYFASFTKKRQVQNVISALKRPDNSVATSTKDILAVATGFYTDLYSEAATDPLARDRLLSMLTARVDPLKSNTLDGTITAKEVESAICQSPSSRAPGPDGLPSELWKKFKSLAPDLAELFNEWHVTGIPKEAKRGVVSLLFKKGDPADVRNYRPITLLNTITKLLTRVLNNRLKTVVDGLICREQTGLPGRYIGETIRTMADLLTHAKKTSTPLAALLIDQEKAFDKVSHHFLQKVLETLGFGPGLRRWIELLYSEAHSQLKINNTLGEEFLLSRGVRQGDCLSPTLFVLCSEPLLQAIIKDKDIKGYPLPDGSTLKVMAYADDTTPVTATPEDIPLLEGWLDCYEKATGATISRSKSELLLFGMDAPQNLKYCPHPVTDPFHLFKFLGVPLALNLNLMDAWSSVMTKFRGCLNAWRACPLSLHGRVVVLRHFAHPILCYQAAFLPMPTTLEKEVASLSWRFLWGKKKKAAFNLETAKLQLDFGGINYPDFPDTLSQVQAKWIPNFLRAGDNTAWKVLAKDLICSGQKRWEHGMSIIYLQGSHYDANSSSDFWNEVLRAFWKLKPHYDLTTTQGNVLARSIPLFNNPRITLPNGKSLATSRWDKFTQKGIRRVCDLLFHDHLGSVEEITGYYGNLPKDAVETLLRAIPRDIVEAATNPPPLTPGLQVGFIKEGLHHVFLIENHPDISGPQLPWAHGWTLSEPFPALPVSLGMTVLGYLWELRPITITRTGPRLSVIYDDAREIHVEDLVCGKRQDPAVGLCSKDISYLLREKHNVTPKHEDTWDLLLRLPPLIPIQWQRVYKRLRVNPVPNKWKDTHLLLLRRSLFLGEKAARQDWDGISHNCLLCATPETHEHLFYHCPRAQKCWAWAKRKWKVSTRRSLSLSLDFALTGGDQLWMFLVSATIQAIWKARCHEIFPVPSAPTPALPILTSILERHILCLFINKHPLLRAITRNAALAKVVDKKIMFSS